METPKELIEGHEAVKEAVAEFRRLLDHNNLSLMEDADFDEAGRCVEAFSQWLDSGQDAVLTIVRHHLLKTIKRGGGVKERGVVKTFNRVKDGHATSGDFLRMLFSLGSHLSIEHGRGPEARRHLCTLIEHLLSILENEDHDRDATERFLANYLEG